MESNRQYFFRYLRACGTFTGNSRRIDRLCTHCAQRGPWWNIFIIQMNVWIALPKQNKMCSCLQPNPATAFCRIQFLLNLQFTEKWKIIQLDYVKTVLKWSKHINYFILCSSTKWIIWSSKDENCRSRHQRDL